MDFMLGCNYWDSKHGTDMWKNFDISVIESDIKALSKNGVKFMRVFPNWRDFQPIHKLYEWSGNHKCYVDDNEQPIDDYEAVDAEQIENFKTFAVLCDKYGIKLQVSIVTGWMSGRLFLPPALTGKNPLKDPEALMWTARFIKGFVNGVKDCKNIVMWGLGNESNCMGKVDSRYEAYVWTAFVRNAIYAADPTRPISSSMHSLNPDRSGWSIRDQGELTDYLCTHPYVSRSIKNNIDLMNEMRSTIFPTAQCVFYADLSGKPSILEEQGSFSTILGNLEVAADFARINIYSAVAHNVKGYFWWCGANHVDLPNPPYTWSMIERDLGMLNCDNSPKPVAREMKKAGEELAKLPFKELSDRNVDATVMLTEGVDKWGVGAVSFVLGHQAGIDVKYAVSSDPLPDSDFYIVPCITGWSVMHQRIWWGMRDKVRENGATMLITFDGGQLSEFEETTGLISNGIAMSGRSHTAKFDFGNIEYKVNFEVELESIGAEVLVRNEEGNIVLSKHKYGKGYVYFLNMPLETMLINKYNAFNNTDYYKIYQSVAKEIIDKKVLVSNNPQIFATLHNDGDKYIAFALNYSNKTQKCDFKLKEGYEIEVIKGSKDSIDKCDCAVYYIKKK